MGRILQMDISVLEYLGTNLPMCGFMDKTFRPFLLHNKRQYSIALAMMSNDMTILNCLDKS